MKSQFSNSQKIGKKVECPWASLEGSQSINSNSESKSLDISITA